MGPVMELQRELHQRQQRLSHHHHHHHHHLLPLLSAPPVVIAQVKTTLPLGVQPATELPRIIRGEGDVKELMRRLKDDFLERQYFVTGALDGSIYDDNCLFEDPMMGFRGLERWRKNLKLVVPFLDQQQVQLVEGPYELPPTSDGTRRVKADWRLITGVKLPWHPHVDVGGATTYEISSEGPVVIVRHTESWNVTAGEAVMQLLFTGSPPDQA